MRYIVLSLFTAAAFFCSSVSADAVTIFGAAELGGGPSTLYNIDPNTGAGTLIGAIGYNRVGGIDFDPNTGILYGVGANPTTDAWELITINTTTGVGTAVGNTGFTFATQDLNFRSDGTLWSYSGGGNIYTLNLTTGAATLVGFIGGGGNPPGQGNALGFDGMDTLYRIDGADIYTINQSDGVATDTMTDVNYPITIGTNPRANAMDYDASSGLFYASVVHSVERTAPVNFIAQIDIATGNVSNVHSTVTALDALAVLPDAQQSPTPPPTNGVPESGKTVVLMLGAIGMLLGTHARKLRLGS